MTFGLNALHGRHKLRGNAWGGAWNHVNTQDFINYTVSIGYAIDSWEFGNTMCNISHVFTNIQEIGSYAFYMRLLITPIF